MYTIGVEIVRSTPPRLNNRLWEAFERRNHSYRNGDVLEPIHQPINLCISLYFFHRPKLFCGLVLVFKASSLFLFIAFTSLLSSQSSFCGSFFLCGSWFKGFFLGPNVCFISISNEIFSPSYIISIGCLCISWWVYSILFQALSWWMIASQVTLWLLVFLCTMQVVKCVNIEVFFRALVNLLVSLFVHSMPE